MVGGFVLLDFVCVLRLGAVAFVLGSSRLGVARVYS